MIFLHNCYIGASQRKSKVVVTGLPRSWQCVSTKSRSESADPEQAKVEKEAAIAAKEEAEAELLFVEGENKAKEQYRHSLDSEIAEKEKQLKDERKAKVDSILDSFGSLVGVGKSAAMEKEIARLKAENKHIRKAFPNAVKTKVEELAKVLVTEKQEAEAERDSALVKNRSLAIERDKAVRKLQEQKDGERQRIDFAVSQATAEKDKTIRLLQDALKASSRCGYPFRHGAAQVFLRLIRSYRHQKRNAEIWRNCRTAEICRRMALRLCGEPTAF